MELSLSNKLHKNVASVYSVSACEVNNNLPVCLSERPFEENENDS